MRKYSKRIKPRKGIGSKRKIKLKMTQIRAMKSGPDRNEMENTISVNDANKVLKNPEDYTIFRSMLDIPNE